MEIPINDEVFVGNQKYHLYALTVHKRSSDHFICIVKAGSIWHLYDGLKTNLKNFQNWRNAMKAFYSVEHLIYKKEVE